MRIPLPLLARFVMACFISSQVLLAQAPAAGVGKNSGTGTVQRKVLIFDFENQTGKVNPPGAKIDIPAKKQKR